MANEKNGTAQAKEKDIRSKKLYWVIGTIIVAAVLFTLYYSVYVASQQAYYTERAFRLLSSMSGKFSLQVQIVDNVLRASTSFPDDKAAGEYVHNVPPGRMDERNFVITKLYKATPAAKPKRDGTLALFMPESQNSFRIRADYREGAQEPVKKEKRNTTPQTSKVPCLEPFSEITVCADIDFDPLIRPSFHDLEEGFFDDVLITDSGGNVLYQESVDGIKIENLNSALLLSAASNSDSLLSKIIPGGKPQSSGETPQVFSALSQTSTQKTVTLGGSDYELYLQPLPVLFKQEKQDQSLVLCGLRTLKHAHAQTLALPYTYLLWGILVLLAIFALGWPMLKLQYMNPKERLQSRQILYLIASVLLGTELITLIALNASYTLITDEISKSELSQLADQINRNVQNELHDALSTLDSMAKNENLLKLVAPVSKTGEPQGEEGTQGSFLNTYDTKFKIDNLAYPYFSYFFLSDENGWQRLKVTINPTRTPWTNVKNQPFFRPVKQHQLSHFVGDGKIHDFRIDPLYSPNTGEFLAVLAAPWVAPSKENIYSPKLSAELIAIKMESLLRPVLPEGYGYAVVDGEGKVLFDSMAVRNLNENFIKEARNNPSLIAALNEGSTTYLDLRYMGTDKKLWITPLRCLSNPRLTLIVFKDSSYFATVNMTVVITFTLLVLTYAILPAFAIAAIHVLFRKRYPLEIIWPNCNRMEHYLSIFVVNALLSLAFLCAYASYGPERSLITIFAIASVAAGYPFLECRQRYRLLANLMVLTILVVVGSINWGLIFAAVFAVYVFYPRIRQLDSWIVNHINLKRIYTLTALSVLVVLVVVPSCGFFKISYEYVQRVFVQVQQLDLAEKIEKRDNTIKDRYANLEAPAKFHSERLKKMWDRYDLVFSNCNSTPPGGTPLDSNFVERGIKLLTANLPVNPLAAQLQELAQTKRGLPNKGWEISGQTITCCPSLAEQSADRCFEIPASGALTLASGGRPVVVSRNPIWPTLYWRINIWLSPLIVLAVWIYFVFGRLFLLDTEPLPTLDLWAPERRKDGGPYRLKHNIMVLGHPKSGKRLTVQDIESVQILDFAIMGTQNKWDIPEQCADVVALNHFEFQIDDAAANAQKLRILEELVYVRHKRVIILSTIDPLYYLAAGCPQTVMTDDKKDISVAIQLLDRWAAALARFQKVRIQDITENRFKKQGFLNIIENRVSTNFGKFARQVVDECDHTAQLRKIGTRILGLRYSSAKNDKNIPSHEELVQELLDRADSYYRTLWATCTSDERLVLYQLAQDGWANPKNAVAIQHLQRRGLITRPAIKMDAPCAGRGETGDDKDHCRAVGIRVMNESFRQFVCHSQHREEIAAWEQEGEQSRWRFLKMSLGILAVAVAAWLLYSQQQFFNEVVAYVGAVGAAFGVVYKLVSDLRGRGSAPTGAAQ